MKSPLSLLTILWLSILPVLFSCSRQSFTVSGIDDHYNSDTYYIAGGFDAEDEERNQAAPSNGSGLGPVDRKEGMDRAGSDYGRRNADRGRGDRLGDTRGSEDWDEANGLVDDDMGISIADYRRTYRRGYRDGQWDANSLPGLYSPNYGGWGWGIGPGIGWNAPCWSWGGGWNYYAYWNNPWNSWNNPWNSWNNPWGTGWGWGGWNGWGGGYGFGYGGWNHWGGWNRWGWGGWNGWGGNTYVWIQVQPRYRSGPRRDRLNQINARSGSGNRMTPWGQARVNGTSRRHGDFISRVSAIHSNWRNSTSDAVVANAGSNNHRGRRLFSLPYAQERPTQREAVDQRAQAGGGYVGNPSGTPRERNYSYRDRFSEAGTGRASYYDKGIERTYGNDRVRGGSWSERSPRSEYSTPRSTYSTPRSTYSTPRSEYSTPRSEYRAPRSEYSTPRSEYSTPRSEYSTPRSTYTPPRSTYTPPRSEYRAPRSEYSSPRSSSSSPRSSSSSLRSSSSSPRSSSSSPRSSSSSPRSTYSTPRSSYSAPRSSSGSTSSSSRSSSGSS
ncbi:MAG: hypothetical protein FJ343_04695, partial [Sphingomonadales bacterium]|nr:hypothetical protein [Sphingomonadales bacterium]